MDIKNELPQIVSKRLIISYGKLYHYPEISDKTKAKDTKHFDANSSVPSLIMNRSIRRLGESVGKWPSAD